MDGGYVHRIHIDLPAGDRDFWSWLPWILQSVSVRGNRRGICEIIKGDHATGAASKSRGDMTGKDRAGEVVPELSTLLAFGDRQSYTPPVASVWQLAGTTTKR